MFRIFIERPVLSTVISIIIVILGLLSLINLPVAQYPEIAPPTIVVSASYTGASAEVILRNVVVPLETQINGVEGMTYMTSSATNDGTASISIYFRLGTNPDQDAVNVQNQVSRASSLLPAEVTQAGVVVRKQQSSNVLMFALKSANPDYDQTFLNNYANINLVPVIQRVYGVGNVNVFGSKDYSMRIWLKPDVMASYGLTPDDVVNALAEQNIDAAPGKFGENSNQVFQYTINYTGRLTDTTEFGNIVMRAGTNGQLLHLRDIARIELGSLTYSTSMQADNQPATVIAVSQTAGSNAQQIITEIIKSLDAESVSFPQGVSYVSLFNVDDFLSASIHKVVETLIEAYLLVFVVVFLFLQDFRSTLIPAISVVVSIIGTFMCLSLFGFTINLLTLFALVLAIGIVVDDAIVVVEAVHARLDEGYQSARKASIDAMQNLSGTIVAITLIMAAVFIPVSFIGGSSGVFFKEFGITLASAIVISAINALTLSPALCAVFLKPKKQEDEKRKNLLQRFYAGFNAGFDAVKSKYQRAIDLLTRRKWMVPAIIFVFLALLVYFMKTTPSGFVPNEDQGTLFADITLPPGTTLERTTEIVNRVDSLVSSEDAVAHRAKIIGFSLMNGSGSNNAFIIIRLKDWGDRPNADIVRSDLMEKVAGIRDGKIIFFAPPTVPGFGISGGFNIELQDKTGGNIADFYKIAVGFLGKLNQRPEILYATTGFNPNYPQYQMSVNVAKCKEAGVTVNSLLSTMQGYYGGLYASNFNEFGKQYRVMVQAAAPYRSGPGGLNNIYVKTTAGTMAPITEFVTMTPIFGPQSISRFNLFTNISVSGSPKPGYSTGDAITAVNEVAAQTLPAGYSFEYSGLTREEVSSGNQTLFIYVLCLLFVYFLLSALYESYILPLSILGSLPIGLFGIYLLARIRGMDNNIYLQIAVIMLIGLLAKNAILIVAYALERRKKGMGIVESAIEGATARLRPILMTSLAFIFGLMPLMVSTGVGAAGNRSIGTGAVGGMLVGTLIGVFVIPVLFIIFQNIQEMVSGGPKPEDTGDEQNEVKAT